MSLFYRDEEVTLLCDDVLAALYSLPADSVQCVVTSPPYWGQRDYGYIGQLGLERTPEAYLVRMVAVFEEIRRILRPDGTLWLNMGDCWQAGDRGLYTKARVKSKDTINAKTPYNDLIAQPHRLRQEGLKNKDLVGMPWRLALALQQKGWYLRMDIIWQKLNPMPESVKDRPTRAHEYLFLLSKSEDYFYDFEAIKEPVNGGAHSRGHGLNPKARAANRRPSSWDDSKGSHRELIGRYPRTKQNASFAAVLSGEAPDNRNKRSVWTIETEAYPGIHYATYPRALVEPCILAGSKPRDTVLDPFVGSGTTCQVAKELGRLSIGIDAKAEYLEDAVKRVRQQTLWPAIYSDGDDAPKADGAVGQGNGQVVMGV